MPATVSVTSPTVPPRNSSVRWMRDSPLRRSFDGEGDVGDNRAARSRCDPRRLTRDDARHDHFVGASDELVERQWQNRCGMRRGRSEDQQPEGRYADSRALA